MSFGRRAALAAVVAVGVGVVLAWPSLAATPAGSGWWTSVPSAPAPVPAVPNPAAPGPGQLGVSATPAGATSVSAVKFTMDDGEVPKSLEVEIAGGFGQQAAVVVACPAANAWAPEAGGPYSDAPAAACDQHQSVAQLTAAGTLLFALDAGFLTKDSLDLVIAPGAVDANGQKVTPLFSLVLANPPAKNLATVKTDTTAPALEPGLGSTDTTSAPVLADSPTSGIDQSGTPPAAVDGSAAPVVDASLEPAPAPAVGPAAPAVVPAPGVALGAVRRTADDGISTDEQARRFGLLLFPLAVLGGIWALNATTPSLRGVGRLARPFTPADADQGEGGLARFRRERIEPPVPLR
jgi:hypothetical protein